MINSPDPMSLVNVLDGDDDGFDDEEEGDEEGGRRTRLQRLQHLPAFTQSDLPAITDPRLLHPTNTDGGFMGGRRRGCAVWNGIEEEWVRYGSCVCVWVCAGRGG